VTPDLAHANSLSANEPPAVRLSGRGIGPERSAEGTMNDARKAARTDEAKRGRPAKDAPARPDSARNRGVPSVARLKMRE
jgi:hypothetical protein